MTLETIEVTEGGATGGRDVVAVAISASQPSYMLGHDRRNVTQSIRWEYERNVLDMLGLVFPTV